MAAAIGDRAALPVHTMYTTGRSPIVLTRLPPPPWRLNPTTGTRACGCPWGR